MSDDDRLTMHLLAQPKYRKALLECQRVRRENARGQLFVAVMMGAIMLMQFVGAIWRW